MTQLRLTRHVGKNCFPPARDIKLIQAAFSFIRVKTKSGRKPLWESRKIDGRRSRALDDAITLFQNTHGLKPTGRINNGGVEIRKINQVLMTRDRMKVMEIVDSEAEGKRFNGKPLFSGRTFKPSNALFDFLKGWEGLHEKPGPDSRGFCTIGHGHLINRDPCQGTDPLEIRFKDGISLIEADQLLRDDIRETVRKTKIWLGQTPVTQPMFDALVSLIFNSSVGPSKAKNLWANLRAGQFEQAAKEFLDIDNETVELSDGSLALVPRKGLTKRRKAESRIFLKGDYSGRP